MAHMTQSRPDSGLDFQTKVHKICQVVPSSLGSVFTGYGFHVWESAGSWSHFIFRNSPKVDCETQVDFSYSRLIDFVYHSTLGLRVIKKKKKLTFDRTSRADPREVIERPPVLFLVVGGWGVRVGIGGSFECRESWV